jgi:hypothetical protein
MPDSYRLAAPSGPDGSGSRSWRPLILAGVAVAALGSGAGVALAATGGPASSGTSASAAAASPSPSPSRLRPPGRMFGRPHRPFGGPGFFHRWAGPIVGPLAGPGLFGAVHGQIVVAKPGGGYQTLDFQRGTVTAVSGTSITLKSADGFTRSYAVTSSTLVDAQRSGIGSVKAGHQVAVSAVQSGSGATARSIADLSLLRQDMPFGRRGHVAPLPSGGAAGTAG